MVLGGTSSYRHTATGVCFRSAACSLLPIFIIVKLNKLQRAGHSSLCIAWLAKGNGDEESQAAKKLQWGHFNGFDVSAASSS